MVYSNLFLNYYNKLLFYSLNKIYSFILLLCLLKFLKKIFQ